MRLSSVAIIYKQLPDKYQWIIEKFCYIFSQIYLSLWSLLFGVNGIKLNGSTCKSNLQRIQQQRSKIHSIASALAHVSNLTLQHIMISGLRTSVTHIYTHTEQYENSYSRSGKTATILTSAGCTQQVFQRQFAKLLVTKGFVIFAKLNKNSHKHLSDHYRNIFHDTEIGQYEETEESLFSWNYLEELLTW